MSEFPVSVVPPVIPYEGNDAPLHTAENGFQCADPTCPCNSVEGRIARLFESPARSETYWDAVRDNASLDEVGTHSPNCRCYWCSAEE